MPDRDRDGGQSGSGGSSLATSHSSLSIWAALSKISNNSASTSSLVGVADSARRSCAACSMRSRSFMSGSCNCDSIFIESESFRSEEHTSELQSLRHLVCRLLLEKKKKKQDNKIYMI